ncbi:MAG: threonine/serine dehydratase [Alphaproteobacteria bacterium]|nr:threonine/serine dehydratase [Alphaproteobacteria bacterium]
MKPVPTLDDVRAAARRLRGIATLTPLLPDRVLSERLDRPVFVKAECLQLTGSFKVRGAYNRIAALEPAERARGVVAFSSGNHAQGVAAAARMFAIPAAIVMPSDAPAAKIAGTRSWGAETVLYDRETQSRERLAAELAVARGATLIPSFDDPHVIAGQGTAGLEIAQQVAARGLVLGTVVTPLGGGGLASGLGLALQAAAPAARLYGVEPEGFDDARRSLAAGRIISNARKGGSRQDALLTPEISDLTFTLLKRLAAGLLTATDDEATAAQAHAAAVLKLIAEPGGAAALAAALHGKLPAGEGALVIVLSGGNA